MEKQKAKDGVGLNSWMIKKKKKNLWTGDELWNRYVWWIGRISMRQEDGQTKAFGQELSANPHSVLLISSLFVCLLSYLWMFHKPIQ